MEKRLTGRSCCRQAAHMFRSLRISLSATCGFCGNDIEVGLAGTTSKVLLLKQDQRWVLTCCDDQFILSGVIFSIAGTLLSVNLKKSRDGCKGSSLELFNCQSEKKRNGRKLITLFVHQAYGGC